MKSDIQENQRLSKLMDAEENVKVVLIYDSSQCLFQNALCLCNRYKRSVAYRYSVAPQSLEPGLNMSGDQRESERER